MFLFPKRIFAVCGGFDNHIQTDIPQWPTETVESEPMACPQAQERGKLLATKMEAEANKNPEQRDTCQRVYF